MPSSIHGEARFMCSELVTVRWVSEFEHSRDVAANLEEIWESGAQLQLPNPIRANTRVQFTAAGADVSGIVRSCAADFIGFFVEIEFEGGYRWSRERYEPEHLFDPRRLLQQDGLKQKNRRTLNDCVRMLSSSETA